MRGLEFCGDADGGEDGHTKDNVALSRVYVALRRKQAAAVRINAAAKVQRFLTVLGKDCGCCCRVSGLMVVSFGLACDGIFIPIRPQERVRVGHPDFPRG